MCLPARVCVCMRVLYISVYVLHLYVCVCAHAVCGCVYACNNACMHLVIHTCVMYSAYVYVPPQAESTVCASTTLRRSNESGNMFVSVRG